MHMIPDESLFWSPLTYNFKEVKLTFGALFLFLSSFLLRVYCYLEFPTIIIKAHLWVQTWWLFYTSRAQMDGKCSPCFVFPTLQELREVTGTGRTFSLPGFLSWEWLPLLGSLSSCGLQGGKSLQYAAHCEAQLFRASGTALPGDWSCRPSQHPGSIYSFSSCVYWKCPEFFFSWCQREMKQTKQNLQFFFSPSLDHWLNPKLSQLRANTGGFHNHFSNWPCSSLYLFFSFYLKYAK